MVPFDADFSGIEDLIDNHHRKKRLTSISSVMKKMMCLSNEIEPLFVAKMKWNLIIMLILYLVWSCFIDSPFRERIILVWFHCLEVCCSFIYLIFTVEDFYRAVY
jgi:hypothetical protein